MIYKDESSGITATSYSKEGNDFLLGMMSIAEEMKHSRLMFQEFIEKAFGINTWHEHNGWLRKEYSTTSDIQSVTRLTWISEQSACHSRSLEYLIEGSQLIVIKDSPKLKQETPFILYVFDVKEQISSYWFREYEIAFNHIKYAKGTGQGFEEFKPSKWWLYWNKKTIK